MPDSSLDDCAPATETGNESALRCQRLRPASDALVVGSRDAPEEMVRQAVVFCTCRRTADPDS